MLLESPNFWFSDSANQGWLHVVLMILQAAQRVTSRPACCYLLGECVGLTRDTSICVRKADWELHCVLKWRNVIQDFNKVRRERSVELLLRIRRRKQIASLVESQNKKVEKGI